MKMLPFRLLVKIVGGMMRDDRRGINVCVLLTVRDGNPVDNGSAVGASVIL
jgi:hypothetical protein